MRTACLLALLGACSAITTKGPPGAFTPQAPPDCTTSRVAVYGDGVLAAGGVATSLFLGLAALGNSGRREELGYATLFTFLGSFVFAGSGVIGGAKVRSSRRAHEQWRMMQAPPYPYPGQYPPPQRLPSQLPQQYPPPPGY